MYKWGDPNMRASTRYCLAYIYIAWQPKWHKFTCTMYSLCCSKTFGMGRLWETEITYFSLVYYMYMYVSLVWDVHEMHSWHVTQGILWGTQVMQKIFGMGFKVCSILEYNHSLWFSSTCTTVADAPKKKLHPFSLRQTYIALVNAPK